MRKGIKMKDKIEISKRDKANMLIGLLGCVNLNNYQRCYPNAYMLLEQNDFDIEKIIALFYDLKFDEETETSHISLMGEAPTIKIKMSEEEDIYKYVELHNVNIYIG